MEQFLKVVQQNRSDLKDFLEKLLRDFVFSALLPLTPNTIAAFNFTFGKLKE